jgi:hypothetical protein
MMDASGMTAIERTAWLSTNIGDQIASAGDCKAPLTSTI